MNNKRKIQKRIKVKSDRGYIGFKLRYPQGKQIGRNVVMYKIRKSVLMSSGEYKKMDTKIVFTMTKEEALRTGFIRYSTKSDPY